MENSGRTVYIYGLHEVGDEDNIRYIGKTVNLKKRLWQHKYNSTYYGNTYVHKWIKSILNKNSNINIKLIETTNEVDWSDREVYWIKYYRDLGYKLTNKTDGGEGGSGYRYIKSYEEIKDWVQNNLNINSLGEWRKYIKHNKLPDFIPYNPRQAYKDRGWVSWMDFLGTNNTYDNDVNYISYEEAKLYIKTHLNHINTIVDWKKAVKSGEIPSFISNRPKRYYEKKGRGWVSWGDFLSTNRVANQNRVYIDYKGFVMYVRSLGIKSFSEWKKYCKTNKLPKNIPTNPNQIYRNSGWISFGEITGTGKISDNEKHKNYLSLEDAMEYVIKNYSFIKNSLHWGSYFREKDNKLPYFIPLNPHNTYKNKGWVSWCHFLSGGKFSKCKNNFLPFKEAREIIRKKGLKNNKEWRKFIVGKTKELRIPAAPNRVYKDEWVSWGDWMGY